MFAEQWAKVVIASIAPVVVISASGLLCLAFYNRLAAIVSRLRAVQRERLQQVASFDAAVLCGDSDTELSTRRLLENLGLQTARIIGRARLIRLTLLCLLTAVGFVIVSSLLNGAARFWPPAAIGAALTFVCGLLSLLAGVFSAIRELVLSLDVVELESQLVSELTEYDGEERAALTVN